MGSHSVTCHLTEVTFPPLPPTEAGTRFSAPGGMQGRVYQGIAVKVRSPFPRLHITVAFAINTAVRGEIRRRGVVVSGVRRMNEINARRARLVHGWVTVFRRVYHLGM